MLEDNLRGGRRKIGPARALNSVDAPVLSAAQQLDGGRGAVSMSFAISGVPGRGDHQVVITARVGDRSSEALSERPLVRETDPTVHFEFIGYPFTRACGTIS